VIEDKHSSENKTFSQTTVNNALKWREENQKDKKKFNQSAKITTNDK
jgi:hypothetical protein